MSINAHSPLSPLLLPGTNENHHNTNTKTKTHERRHSTMRLLVVLVGIALGTVPVVESRKDPYYQDSGKHVSSKSGKSSKSSSHLSKSSKRSGSKSGKGGSKSAKSVQKSSGTATHSGYNGYDELSASALTDDFPVSAKGHVVPMCNEAREAKCCNNPASNSNMLNRRCKRWGCFPC